jgi:hypothetical protein
MVIYDCGLPATADELLADCGFERSRLGGRGAISASGRMGVWASSFPRLQPGGGALKPGVDGDSARVGGGGNAGIAYEQADNTADISQTLRVVLDRMEREVRTAASVASPNSMTLDITPVQDPGAPKLIEYSYTGGTLFYKVTPAVGAQVSYPLLAGTDKVTANAFNVALQTCVVNGQTVTQSATATIGFSVNGQQLTMRASAAVRQNQSY